MRSSGAWRGTAELSPDAQQRGRLDPRVVRRGGVRGRCPSTAAAGGSAGSANAIVSRNTPSRRHQPGIGPSLPGHRHRPPSRRPRGPPSQSTSTVRVSTRRPDLLHLERRFLGRPDQVGGLVAALGRCGRRPTYSRSAGVKKSATNPSRARLDDLEVDAERARCGRSRAGRRGRPPTRTDRSSTRRRRPSPRRVWTYGAPLVVMADLDSGECSAGERSRSRTVAIACLAVHRRVRYSLATLREANRVEMGLLVGRQPLACRWHVVLTVRQPPHVAIVPDDATRRAVISLWAGTIPGGPARARDVQDASGRP